MTAGELKKWFDDFYDKVKDYRELLSASRDSMFPDIVRNFDEIAAARQHLIRTYAKLQIYVERFGNKPRGTDGVSPVRYSPYDNAFSTDILLRVGPSTDAIIHDLNFIIGKLEAMDPNLEVDAQQDLTTPGTRHAEVGGLKEKTEEELVEIIRRAENTNVPNSLYNRAKIELELRDRQIKISDKSTPSTHVGDVFNVMGSVMANQNGRIAMGSKIKMAGRDDALEKVAPWYRQWWMLYIIYPVAIVLIGVIATSIF